MLTAVGCWARGCGAAGCVEEYSLANDALALPAAVLSRVRGLSGGAGRLLKQRVSGPFHSQAGLAGGCAAQHCVCALL